MQSLAVTHSGGGGGGQVSIVQTPFSTTQCAHALLPSAQTRQSWGKGPLHFGAVTTGGGAQVSITHFLFSMTQCAHALLPSLQIWQSAGSAPLHCFVDVTAWSADAEGSSGVVVPSSALLHPPITSEPTNKALMTRRNDFMAKPFA